MSFEPRDYLRHIQVEVEYLQGSCAGLKLEEFLANETLSTSLKLKFSDNGKIRI
jgi:hypothetical protein